MFVFVFAKSRKNFEKVTNKIEEHEQYANTKIFVCAKSIESPPWRQIIHYPKANGGWRAWRFLLCFKTLLKLLHITLVRLLNQPSSCSLPCYAHGRRKRRAGKPWPPLDFQTWYKYIVDRSL